MRLTEKTAESGTGSDEPAPPGFTAAPGAPGAAAEGWQRRHGALDGRGAPAWATAPAAAPGLSAGELDAYRAAVCDLLAEVRAAGPQNTAAAEQILARRLGESEFSAVLAATPHGTDGAATRLILELRGFRPGSPAAAPDLITLIRIWLSAQIEAAWWGRAPAYLTDTDVLRSPGLLDLERLRKSGMLRFQYRRQVRTVAGRAARAARRRLLPGGAPHTAGLRFARATSESVALLNGLAREFAVSSPPRTPALWVTSLARSVEHQHRLRSLGYPALLPSSHCTGHAMDIEVDWFRRFGADGPLTSLLLGLQQAGTVNVIDEGQAWHVCISPAAARGLRRLLQTETGG